MKRYKFPLILLIFVCIFNISILSMPVYAGPPPPENREVRLGREAEKEVEREYKLLDDPAILERINTIAKPIVDIANSTPVDASYGNSEIVKFEYKFKLLDDDAVNAFSLPGGTIYICKGLLDYAQSDHELAGVIAHEIAHAAHHHMLKILKQQSRMDGQIALVLLAGMLSNVDSDNLGNILVGAHLLRTAKTSGYGQKAETDADLTAITYMHSAGYNPVGMLTFLERLAKDANALPQVDMGILQTHPAPRDRCRQVLSQIKTMGLPVNRRTVTNTQKAVVTPDEIDGRKVAKVMLGEKVLFMPVTLNESLTSTQRAEAIAVKINQILDLEPQIREVSVSGDGKSVIMKGETIITVADEDCALCGKTVGEVTSQAADLLKRVVWQEMVDRMYLDN